VVIKSSRCVYSGYSGFLPHKDCTNPIIGANENDLYKVAIACFVTILKMVTQNFIKLNCL